MGDTHETIVSVMGTQRRALLEQVKQLELMVAQNYPTLFSVAVMVMSMRTTETLRDNFVGLKHDQYLKESNLVGYSAFYKNYKKLLQRTEDALWYAKNCVEKHFDQFINCSFCGLVASKHTTCHARLANTVGASPETEVKWVKVNNAPRMWDRKWHKARKIEEITANHSTWGGARPGGSARRSELLRHLEQDLFDWFEVRDYSKPQAVIDAEEAERQRRIAAWGY
tara:strand:+ start:565 stop:1239 length:675 start_codon:yes stop_codon:yes gene_type:complete